MFAHIPVTGKLFGDELQSQLNSIKASNKISNLAAGASSRRFHDKPGNNNKNGKPFLGQRGKRPHKKTVGDKEAVTANCSLNDLLGQVDINNFVSLIPAFTDYFTLRARCFKAGQLIYYVDNWKLITSDQEILSMIQGLHTEFQSIPFQKEAPLECAKQSEMDVISTETEKLLQEGVIVATGYEKGDFISPIFIRTKKDGSFRLILNLQRLN